MSWKNALVDYAKTRDPAGLPSEILLMHTEQTLTIWDKYPKAMFQWVPGMARTSALARNNTAEPQYSFLTLPRLPFKERESGDDIPQATLDSLGALLSSKNALRVLKILKSASDEVN
jgi:hypothetical protein